MGQLFFQGKTMSSVRKANGIYHELLLDGKSCGYALSINSADQIKKMAHLFSDITRMVFDEFQSETNHYCNDEVNKFRSIHTSIARGGGKQVRYVPVYMLSNPVTLLNPYYVAMNVYNMLQPNTKFLKGNGFVIEQGYVESAGKAQKESGFNRAFGEDKFTSYLTESSYLNDNVAFIEKPSGKSSYVATLRYNGTDYAIREYAESGILYCDKTADTSYPIKIAVTTEDHNVNYVMLKANASLLSYMRFIFDRGHFRFKDLSCKDAIMHALSY